MQDDINVKVIKKMEEAVACMDRKEKALELVKDLFCTCSKEYGNEEKAYLDGILSLPTDKVARTIQRFSREEFNPDSLAENVCQDIFWDYMEGVCEENDKMDYDSMVFYPGHKLKTDVRKRTVTFEKESSAVLKGYEQEITNVFSKYGYKAVFGKGDVQEQKPVSEKIREEILKKISTELEITGTMDALVRRVAETVENTDKFSGDPEKMENVIQDVVSAEKMDSIIDILISS